VTKRLPPVTDADAVAGEVIAAGGTASAHALDVADVGSIQAVVDAVADHHGRLDVLVANAGLGPITPRSMSPSGTGTT